MARRGDGEDVIVYFRIVIEGRPLAEKGQAPGEINRAETSAGVTAREFFCSGGIADAVEAAPERTQCHRFVSHAAPDDRALKTDFNVGGYLERNFFGMSPGTDRIVMTLERSDEKVVA